MPGYRRTIVSVSLLALALAGCNKSAQDMNATTATAGGLPPLPAALPMQTGPASQLVAAPPVSALPVRRYVGVSRPAREREGYAYLDRASDVQDEIGNAPPDYDYDNNDGVSPYVWETRDGDYRYAEPADGGYRDYYYQRGEDTPYLVRTRDRSYAYAGGALVAVYLLSGALVPPDRYGGYRDEASRYFGRGQELRYAAEQRPHQGVNAANWADQRPRFATEQARWVQARSQQPEWQAYHAQNDPSRQPDWQQEHQQRQQVAQQFAGWQSHGFASAPPPVLAVAGPRAAPPPSAHQPGMYAANRPAPVVGPPAMAGPPTPVPALVPNTLAQAAAAREQQLTAQRLAQQQALASQRMAQAASRAQQEAAAQRQTAAARQQQLAARDAAQQQALVGQKAQLQAEQQAARGRQQAARARQQAAADQQLAAAREHQLAIRQAADQQQAAARERQLAARSAAQQQALASQKAEQAAIRDRQQAAAQQQAANAQRHQEAAAQAQMAARQQAQQREALAAAHQAQAAAAQRQAEVARAQAPHANPGHAASGNENDRQKQ